MRVLSYSDLRSRPRPYDAVWKCKRDTIDLTPHTFARSHPVTIGELHTFALAFHNVYFLHDMGHVFNVHDRPAIFLNPAKDL